MIVRKMVNGGECHHQTAHTLCRAPLRQRKAFESCPLPSNKGQLTKVWHWASCGVWHTGSVPLSAEEQAAEQQRRQNRKEEDWILEDDSLGAVSFEEED